MLHDLAQGLRAGLGGKGSSSSLPSGAGAQLPSAAFESSYGPSSSSGAAASSRIGGPSSFRTAGLAGAGAVPRHQDQEQEYDHFQGTAAAAAPETRLSNLSPLGIDSASLPQRPLALAYDGPRFHSAADFDAPLHAVFRQEQEHRGRLGAPSLSLSDGLGALRLTSEQEQEEAAGLEDAWAGASASAGAGAGLQGGGARAEDDFMAALAAEEAAAGHSMAQEAGTIPLSHSQLEPLADEPDGYPAPAADSFLATHLGLTPALLDSGALAPEQLRMHHALSTLQSSDADPARLAERLVPPDDDRLARQGAYALTPEEAFRGILGGAEEVQRENERARARRQDLINDRQAGGQREGGSAVEVQVGEVELQRLRQYLPRGTFVDVSQGLPFVAEVLGAKHIALRRKG